jgi:hypothetical protein
MRNTYTSKSRVRVVAIVLITLNAAARAQELDCTQEAGDCMNAPECEAIINAAHPSCGPAPCAPNFDAATGEPDETCSGGGTCQYRPAEHRATFIARMHNNTDGRRLLDCQAGLATPCENDPSRDDSTVMQACMLDEGCSDIMSTPEFSGDDAPTTNAIYASGWYASPLGCIPPAPTTSHGRTIIIDQSDLRNGVVRRTVANTSYA